MKKFLSILISLFLLLSFFVFPASAVATSDAGIAIEQDQIVVSRTVEQLGDGCYFIETIYVPNAQLYSSTKTGTKTAECVYYGTTIFTISVTGVFTYDGSTSDATSASGKIAAYVENVTLNSRRAYTSGSSAIATCSISYNGSTIQKTVTLTCDKNGNLS